MDKAEKEVYLKIIKESYFINTNGKIVKWKWGLKEATEWASIHAGIASKLYPKIEDGTDYLYNLGWILVGSLAYGTRMKNEPTQAQINTLNDLGFYNIRDSRGISYKIS